jgi:hypothetical protein
MRSFSIGISSLVCLALALTACSVAATPLARPQVIDIVWQALESNTSSHDLSQWQVVEARSVAGREVVKRFAGDPVPGRCAPGPTPPNNSAIVLDASYWYVQLKPRYATPLPQLPGRVSATAPPRVPEPVLHEAHFLVDPVTGLIVARKLFCIIY